MARQPSKLPTLVVSGSFWGSEVIPHLRAKFTLKRAGSDVAAHFIMPTEGIGIMMLVLQDDLDTRALAEELRASQAVLREVHCLVETKFQDLFDEVQLEIGKDSTIIFHMVENASKAATVLLDIAFAAGTELEDLPKLAEESLAPTSAELCNCLLIAGVHISHQDTRGLLRRQGATFWSTMQELLL